MSMVWEQLRKMVSVLFVGGIVIMLFGISESAWSASDVPASADQQNPAATPDSSAGPAKGAEGKGHHAMKKACVEDAKKLCPDVKPGEGRIARCLKQHVQELSPGCVEMVQQRAKGRQ